MNRVHWTSEQLLSLADNEHKRRTSQNFALEYRWKSLVKDQDTVWGVLPLKGSAPIQAAFKTHPLSFYCTCNTRQQPCFHALGLALLYTAKSELFLNLSLSKELRELTDAPLSMSDTLASADEERHQVLLGGLDSLERWLTDMIAEGLESVRTKPRTYWLEVADRLFDVRASELALEIRSWAELDAENWAETLLARMGRVQLIIDGFKRFEALPESIQADLYLAIGWRPKQAADPYLRDTWLVLGSRIEQQLNQKVQRIWLWGQSSGRPALLVRPIRKQKESRHHFLSGMYLDAELAYLAGSIPLRAELGKLYGYVQAKPRVDAHASIKQALRALSSVEERNPWLTHLPLLLENVSALKLEDRWHLLDDEGHSLSLPNKFMHGWTLRSAKSDVNWMFAEYKDRQVYPLSVWIGDRLADLRVLKGIK